MALSRPATCTFFVGDNFFLAIDWHHISVNFTFCSMRFFSSIDAYSVVPS